jgi:hypothetical protein
MGGVVTPFSALIWAQGEGGAEGGRQSLQELCLLLPVLESQASTPEGAVQTGDAPSPNMYNIMCQSKAK